MTIFIIEFQGANGNWIPKSHPYFLRKDVERALKYFANANRPHRFSAYVRVEAAKERGE